jgi:hypothetical protein
MPLLNPLITVSRFGSAVEFDLRTALKYFGLDP